MPFLYHLHKITCGGTYMCWDVWGWASSETHFTGQAPSRLPFLARGPLPAFLSDEGSLSQERRCPQACPCSGESSQITPEHWNLPVSAGAWWQPLSPSSVPQSTAGLQGWARPSWRQGNVWTPQSQIRWRDSNLVLFKPIPWFQVLFLLFFRASPEAYGSSQARGQIGATAAGLHHSHSHTRIWAKSVTYTTAHGNARSSTHWARPGIKAATSWFLVGVLSTVPQ